MSQSLLTAVGKVQLVRIPCPACGAERHQPMFWDRSHRNADSLVLPYVECSECATIYLAHVPSESSWEHVYSALFSGASATAQSAPRPEPQPLFDGVRRRLARMTRSTEYYEAFPHGPGYGKSILDIGCGTGDYLRAKSADGWEVYGQDISPETVSALDKLFPGRVYFGKVTEARYSENAFDVVRSSNVLEHIVNPAEVLSEVWRILKPGGVSYHLVPSATALSVKAFGRYSLNCWVPCHVALYTKSSLSVLAQRAGFSQVEIVDVSGPSFLAAGWATWRRRANPEPMAITGGLSVVARTVAMPLALAARGLGFGEYHFLKLQKPTNV